MNNKNRNEKRTATKRELQRKENCNEKVFELGHGKGTLTEMKKSN